MAKITVHATLRRLHSFLDRTQQVTGALASFRDLNPISGLGLAAQVTRLATEFLSKDLVDLSKGWKELPLPYEMVGLVESFCAPTKEAAGDSWDYYKVGGQGVFFDHREYRTQRFLVEHDPGTFQYQMRSSFWAKYGDHILVEPKPVGAYEVEFFLTNDPQRKALPSERAEQVWARIHPFMSRGITRSLLLDGRPGTGKTTISQFLVRQAKELLPGAHVLRIPTGDFTYMSSRMLQGLITLLEPQILVIDDFDRIAGVEALLDFLESCRQTIRFLVVTTNHLENLPHAVTRPGRFDEIQVIEGLGPAFVETFLGPLWARLSEEQRQLVLPWPVAFLEEFRSRMNMLDRADLEAELADLKTRVEKKETPWWRKLQEKTETKPATPCG